MGPTACAPGESMPPRPSTHFTVTPWCDPSQDHLQQSQAPKKWHARPQDCLTSNHTKGAMQLGPIKMWLIDLLHPDNPADLAFCELIWTQSLHCDSAISLVLLVAKQWSKRGWWRWASRKAWWGSPYRRGNRSSDPLVEDLADLAGDLIWPFYHRWWFDHPKYMGDIIWLVVWNMFFSPKKKLGIE